MIQIREYSRYDLEAMTELMADLGYPSTRESMQKRMERMEAIPLYYTFVAVLQESWAKEQGSHLIYLTSGSKPERLTAHEFYKSMGYDVNGYRFVKSMPDNC